MSNTDPMPVFAIDRLTFASRAAMADVVEDYARNGSIVQVEDGSRPRALRLCYEVRPADRAFRLFNSQGFQVGVFANVKALVDVAEAMTGA